jgi:hypothetical protein
MHNIAAVLQVVSGVPLTWIPPNHDRYRIAKPKPQNGALSDQIDAPLHAECVLIRPEIGHDSLSVGRHTRPGKSEI